MTWGRHGRHTLESAKARFLAKTERRENGCLLWIGALNGSKRYGAVSVFGKQMLSHRASYVLFKGPIPIGLCVCHTCDNGLCVDPDHLFLGTQTENIQDMERKGRSVHPSGAQHGRSKLTWDNVEKIRAAHALGASVNGLARDFGVDKTSISRIVKNKGWLPVDP